MYCPKCEFEIKQEVNECPICGGALTALPEEGADTNANSFESEEAIANNQKPLDACISELILDAKHELDSIDSNPNTEQQPVEPFASSLDFESMLSEETAEPARPAAEPSLTEPLLFDTVPETTQTNEDAFLLDDAPSPLPGTDAPMASDPSTEPEQRSESLFSDDNLFLDETSAPAAFDTNLFIEEPLEKKPESFPDSEMIPTAEQSSSQPWSLDELSAPEPEEALHVIPEEQEKQRDTEMAGGLDFIELKEESPAVETEEQPIDSGARSKKRLVFILLFGVLLIAGTYLFKDSLLQVLEPTQIEKPVPLRMVPPAVKKPLTLPEPIPPAPSALPEKAADAAPAEAQQQAIEPQPEPSPPEDIRADTTAKKPVPEQIIISKEKPAPAAEPVKSIQETIPLPDKEKSPAKLAYSIHVASFKKQQSAEEQIKNLRTDGFDAYLETVDLGAKGIWHRVKVGHYATRAEAKQAIKIIQQNNPGPTPIININR
jgi:cell division septation protein DedD